MFEFIQNFIDYYFGSPIEEYVEFEAIQSGSNLIYHFALPMSEVKSSKFNHFLWCELTAQLGEVIVRLQLIDTNTSNPDEIIFNVKEQRWQSDFVCGQYRVRKRLKTLDVEIPKQNIVRTQDGQVLYDPEWYEAYDPYVDGGWGNTPWFCIRCGNQLGVIPKGDKNWGHLWSDMNKGGAIHYLCPNTSCCHHTAPLILFNSNGSPTSHPGESYAIGWVR